MTNSNDTAGYIRQMGVEPVIEPPGVDLSRFSVPRGRLPGACSTSADEAPERDIR